MFRLLDLRSGSVSLTKRAEITTAMPRLRGTKDAIAPAIDIVVHIDRIEGQRRVAQVISVDGYDPARTSSSRARATLPRLPGTAPEFELPSAHERINPARPSGSAPLRGRCARV